jgi:hypothetical protein
MIGQQIPGSSVKPKLSFRKGERRTGQGTPKREVASGGAVKFGERNAANSGFRTEFSLGILPDDSQLQPGARGQGERVTI